VFPPNDTDKGVHIFIILCESVGKRYVVIKNYVVCTDKSHPLGTSLGVFPLNGTDEGVRIFSMVFVNVDRRDMAIKYIKNHVVWTDSSKIKLSWGSFVSFDPSSLYTDQNHHVTPDREFM